MRAAARGALPVSPAEMLEILVLLTKDPVFRRQASMTLAGWDLSACSAVLGNPATPRAVLEYFLSPENRRSSLLTALLENPSVSDSDILTLTQENSRDTTTLLLANPRVMSSPNLLNALITNPVLTPEQVAQDRKSTRLNSSHPSI